MRSITLSSVLVLVGPNNLNVSQGSLPPGGEGDLLLCSYAKNDSGFAIDLSQRVQAKTEHCRLRPEGIGWTATKEEFKLHATAMATGFWVVIERFNRAIER